jgi:hypothetical protein
VRCVDRSLNDPAKALLSFGCTTAGDAFAFDMLSKPYFRMSLHRLATRPEILGLGFALDQPVEML